MNLVRNIPNLVQSSLRTLLKSPSITVDNNINQWPSVIKRDKSLASLHRKGFPVKERVRHKVLDGNPCLKGVVLKTLIKKPRKPNSANRKCVLVKLSNGKEVVAYVPGIGHNLQEHQFVLVNGKRPKDVPGVSVSCVRGKYDLPHVEKTN